MASNQEEVRRAAIQEMARRELASRTNAQFDSVVQSTGPTVQQQPRPADAPNAPFAGGREMSSRILEALTPEINPEKYGDLSVESALKEGYALVENAISLGSGIISTPVAGIEGLLVGVGNLISPRATSSLGYTTAADAVKHRIEALTFAPKTEAGERTQQAIARPFNAIESFADNLSENMAYGNPIAATFFKTTLLGGLAVVGGVRGIRRMRRRTADINAIDAGLTELGIEIGPELRSQIALAGEGMAVTEKGAAMVAIQQALRTARDRVRASVDAKFDIAKGMDASLPGASIRELNLLVAEKLSGRMDTQSFGRLQDRLRELSALEERTRTRVIEGDPIIEGGGRVGRVIGREPDVVQARVAQLNEVEQIRRNINRNRAPESDVAQNEALGILKRSIDDFMDDQLNRDLISGDPLAVQAWKDARAANTSYRARFRDNKVIRDLIDKEANTIEMRNWVMGATQAGFKAEAGRLVDRIGDLIGKNSPEFNGLRHEFIYNIIEPLIPPGGGPPNLRQFVQRYDRLIRNNDPVVNALALDSKSHLARLRNIAEATERTGAAPVLSVEIERVAAQALFGHQIARAGLRVRLATMAFQILRGSGASERNAVISELIGYDSTSPMISRTSAAAAAVIVGEIEDNKNDVGDTLGLDE